MDNLIPGPAVMQSAPQPDHGSGAHHRDGNRIIPLPANNGKEQGAVKGCRIVQLRRPDEANYSYPGGPVVMIEVGYAEHSNSHQGLIDLEPGNIRA